MGGTLPFLFMSLLDDKAEEHLRKLFQSSENLSGNEWEEEVILVCYIYLNLYSSKLLSVGILSGSPIFVKL